MPTVNIKARHQDINEHVAQKIRALRIERGLSQEQLGAALGITFQQVQKYEKATNRVSAGTLWKIAEVLDAPIEFFFPKTPGEKVSPILGVSIKSELKRLTDNVARLTDRIAA